MIITCCKRCEAPKRHLGCHSTCQEYLAERARMDAANKARERGRQYDRDVIDAHMRRKWSYLRRHINGGRVMRD